MPDVALLCTRAVRVAEAREFNGAGTLLQQAMEIAGDDKRLRGRVEVALCRVDTLRGDLETAHEHGARALDLLQDHGDAEDIAEASIYLGSVEGARARFPAAESLYSKALRLLANSQDQRLIALAHWGMGSATGDQERFEQAHEHLAVAVECGRDLLTLTERGRLQHYLAIMRRECGLLGEALELSTAALRMLEVAGEMELVADVHNSIGSIHARRGDRRAARASYERALAALNNQPAMQAAEAYHEMARLDMEEGQVSTALSRAQVALETALRLRSPLDEGRASLVLGQALVSLDRCSEALPHLQRALAIFTECGMEQSQIVASDILRYVKGGT